MTNLAPRWALYAVGIATVFALGLRLGDYRSTPRCFEDQVYMMVDVISTNPEGPFETEWDCVSLDELQEWLR